MNIKMMGFRLSLCAALALPACAHNSVPNDKLGMLSTGVPLINPPGYIKEVDLAHLSVPTDQPTQNVAVGTLGNRCVAGFARWETTSPDKFSPWVQSRFDDSLDIGYTDATKEEAKAFFDKYRGQCA